MIQLSLNIPGPDKLLPGCLSLFHWGKQTLSQELVVAVVAESVDALGPVAFFASPREDRTVKALCCGIEERHPFTRLLDFDVYGVKGRACDRAGLDLPQRTCLVCEQPARECMRTRRHSAEQMRGSLEELLKPFVVA